MLKQQYNVKKIEQREERQEKRNSPCFVYNWNKQLGYPWFSSMSFFVIDDVIKKKERTNCSFIQVFSTEFSISYAHH